MSSWLSSWRRYSSVFAIAQGDRKKLKVAMTTVIGVA